MFRLDTTHHYPTAAAVVDTVVAEGTVDNTGHTVAKHNQVGCRLLVVDTRKPQPYARILPGTCPSDMTAYTTSSLSPLGVSPSYPSYRISPA
ncbi:hypothetical protein Tco_1058923 [Tanacetum coccineum]